MRYLLLLACVGCATTLPAPGGGQMKVKTPCDSQLWAVRKVHGEPTQITVSDKDYWRIHYYYADTHTEYAFGWNDLQGCYSDKKIHLTDDEIH